MSKQTRRKHSDQFKQDAISMVVDNSGKITEVRSALSLFEQTLGGALFF